MPSQDIASGIPELNAGLDPDRFAASNEVVTADTVQADVERLEPPSDIDAATIGDYTPYEAVSGELSEDSTVQGRMSGLLSQNSDYIQRGRVEADAESNRRGMFNSSMAIGASEGAAIDRALPIAQQDAAAFKEQQFLNQGYDNDAARYLAEQSVERENLQAGLDQDTNQFNQTNTLENERLNADAQNLSGRDYAQAQNLAEANAAAEANRMNFAVLDGDIRAQLAEIDHEAALGLETLAREYALMENLDSIQGGIYEQLIAEIGTILVNEEKSGTAQAKINALIAAAGVEIEFSSGGVAGSSSGGGPSEISDSDVRPPSPGAGYVWDESSWQWKRQSSGPAVNPNQGNGPTGGDIRGGSDGGNAPTSHANPGAGDSHPGGGTDNQGADTGNGGQGSGGGGDPGGPNGGGRSGGPDGGR